jgi:hypothetical protein
MKSEIWKNKLKPFVEKFPQSGGKDVEVYTPIKGIPIKLLFEGPLFVEGQCGDMLLNLGDPDILTLTIRSKNRAIRLAWDKLIGFELSTHALWK